MYHVYMVDSLDQAVCFVMLLWHTVNDSILVDEPTVAWEINHAKGFRFLYLYTVLICS